MHVFPVLSNSGGLYGHSARRQAPRRAVTARPPQAAMLKAATGWVSPFSDRVFVPQRFGDCNRAARR